MAAAPHPHLASLEALWAAPLHEVAALLLHWTFSAQLATDPYPAVGEHVPEGMVIDSLPETRVHGLVTMGPQFSAARQVVREAMALLEVNGLIYRTWNSNGQSTLHLTRRGHAAVASGDPAAAMTVSR